MAAILPLTWRLPDAVEIESGRPVLGRTLTAFAGALNHINGLHARGWYPVTGFQLASLAAADTDDVGFIKTERDHEHHRIPMYVAKGVTLLRVAVVALAYETGGTDEPEVAVSVYDSGGAAVDAGFTLLRGNGSLPGGEHEVAGANYLIPFVGELANRTLDVTAKQGSVVVLRIDTVRTLVLAAFVMPQVEATL